MDKNSVVVVRLVLILASLSSLAQSYNYLQEVPVKLLDVRSVASRYPAANSEYRTGIENGQVQQNFLVDEKRGKVERDQFFRMKK